MYKINGDPNVIQMDYWPKSRTAFAVTSAQASNEGLLGKSTSSSRNPDATAAAAVPNNPIKN